MLGVNTRTRYRMKALAAKDTPRTGPSVVMFWKRKHNTARELRFDILRISSLRPFHRFLRPATRNLSPADTYPLYQERTSVRRPGRVFCKSEIWKGEKVARGSHVSGGQGAGAPKVSGSLAVCVSRFSRIIVLTCYFALRVYCLLAKA